MQTFTEAGRGRKHCPSCNQYIGVRTLVCDCGHTFNSTIKARESHFTVPAVDNTSSLPMPSYSGMMNVGTPAGPCPVKLVGLMPIQITEWANALREHYQKQNLNLLDEAIVYFARRLYDFKSQEFNLIRNAVYGA